MTTTSSRAAASRFLDIAGAAAAGAGAFALYLATLQPAFGGPEDTPKFQFVGHVLGLPHPPGYPLYVLLSHLFVQIPVGTIAYRANLFSAVLAALACSLTYTIGRQIGARRGAAVCGALGLATGASFWRGAVFAEVYSLAAVMAALTIFFLLEWRRRGQSGWLLASIGAFSLGLGNHLTIVGVVPACVVYVLSRNRRAVTPRLLASAIVLLIVGVAQYGLIIVRTRQNAPYLESRATSLSELVAVVTAQRFAAQRFAFSAPELFGDHIPAVMMTIGRELGLVGMATWVLGAIVTVRTRNGDAALVAGAAGGMLAMVVNLEGDLRGFITPVMPCIWPLAALGLEGLARGVESLRGGRRLHGALAAVAAAAIASPNFIRNYHDADQSGHVNEARFLRAVYGWLPDRAGIVVEDYWSDMALQYYLLTGEAGPSRGMMRVAFNAGDAIEAARLGHRVFAFAKGATFLGAQGLRFERFAVRGTPIDLWLKQLPVGTLVVGATADVPPLDLSGIGQLNARPIGRPQAFEAFAVLARHAGAAWRKADDAASLIFETATLQSSPSVSNPIRASADRTVARIEVDGRTIAQVEKGIVLAVFAPDGELTRALEFPAGGSLEVAFQEALYELAGSASCVELTTDTWRDVWPALSTGSWVATSNDVGSTTIESEFEESRGLRADVSELLGAGTARTVSSTDRSDGMHVLRTELSRTGANRPVFRLTLDRQPVRARARVLAGGVRSSITVCAHHPARPIFARDASLGILRPDFEAESYFGAGWGGAERTRNGPVRHSGGTGALLLPLHGDYQYRVSLDVVAATTTTMDVVVNAERVGSCEVGSGAPCDVTLQPPVLKDGLNVMTLSTRPAAPDRQSAQFTFRGARIIRTPRS